MAVTTTEIPTEKTNRELAELLQIIANEAKLRTETGKLQVETKKLYRDYLLTPVLATAAVMGGTAGFVVLGLKWLDLLK